MALNRLDIRNWRSRFDQRAKQQIDFSRLYVSQFNHGADGHNSMQIISEMSYILDAVGDAHKELAYRADMLEKKVKELEEQVRKLEFEELAEPEKPNNRAALKESE